VQILDIVMHSLELILVVLGIFWNRVTYEN
jgi:hypothetical protein